MNAPAVNFAVPAPVVTQEDLNNWYELAKQLEEIKTLEMALRKKIFGAYFTKPREGTNTAPLSEGWVLKGQYIINRKVDIALLTTHTADLREKHIPIKDLITYKPELVTLAYRKLTDAQRVIFDEVLDIKVGAPSLEIVLPKRG